MILYHHSSLTIFYSRYFKYRFPAIITIIILFLLPSDGLGITICWFKMLFDLPCPACGLTRGMSSLLHFEFYKSLMYQPLAVSALGYLFVLALFNKADFFRESAQKKSGALKRIFSFKFVTLLFIIVWIIRLFNIYFFN